MYELYTEPEGFKLLNITTVNYSRHIHTQQYSHGGSIWREPVGESFSDLCLDGPCDYLAGSFFYRLSELGVAAHAYPAFLSSFYVTDNSADYTIKVSGASINSWQYTDCEDRTQETYSLTFSVRNIQRLIEPILESKKNYNKVDKKVKEKKVIIPERQIVVCRML